MIDFHLAVVDRSYKCIDGCTDDIRVNAGSPGESSVWFLDSYVSNRFGTGALLKRMLLVGNQCKFQFVSFLQCVADCIQTTISGCLCCNCLSIEAGSYLSNDSTVFLLEMYFADAVWADRIFES